MHTIVQKMGYSENTEVKFVEPNKGRRIAVAGDINTIVASRQADWSFFENNLYSNRLSKDHAKE